MCKTEPTVFVVDDDPSVSDSLALLLRSAGRRAETFSSASDFLDRFDPERPGCLLLDLHMPGMNGPDLQDRMNELRSSLPVIILSAHTESAMARKALERGAIDFVQKPFRDEELLRVIERAIDEDFRRRRERNEIEDAAATAPGDDRCQGDGS